MAAIFCEIRDQRAHHGHGCPVTLIASFALHGDQPGVLEVFQMKGNAVVRLPQMLGNIAGYQTRRLLFYQQAKNLQAHRRGQGLQAGDDLCRVL